MKHGVRCQDSGRRRQSARIASTRRARMPVGSAKDGEIRRERHECLTRTCFAEREIGHMPAQHQSWTIRRDRLGWRRGESPRALALRLATPTTSRRVRSSPGSAGRATSALLGAKRDGRVWHGRNGFAGTRFGGGW